MQATPPHAVEDTGYMRPMPASGGIRILAREKNRFLEPASPTGGGKWRTKQNAKEAQGKEQLMGLGKWKNTS